MSTGLENATRIDARFKNFVYRIYAVGLPLDPKYGSRL